MFKEVLFEQLYVEIILPKNFPAKISNLYANFVWAIIDNKQYWMNFNNLMFFKISKYGYFNRYFDYNIDTNSRELTYKIFLIIFIIEYKKLERMSYSHNSQADSIEYLE